MYGLRLPDVGPESGQMLPVAPDSWPTWTVRYADAAGEAAGPVPTWEWGDDRAVLPLQPDGYATIDRRSRTSVLAKVSTSESALLHPYFGSTALAHATWSGRLALHGGVLSTPSGSWGLLGEREAGKSSALAWWIADGDGVVADDLVVTDGRAVFAGPRFVDLRESAHTHFGLGVDVGVLGTRRRWRTPLAAVAAETPFAGLVELAWGDRVGVELVPMAGRFEIVHRNRGLRLPIDAVQQTVLQVLSKPVLRFTRPKSWAALDDAMHRLRDTLAAY